MYSAGTGHAAIKGATILYMYEPPCEKASLWGFRPCHTQTRPHKMARGLKFRIKEVEGLYFLYSVNKGADLRLCFRICKKPVFS